MFTGATPVYKRLYGALAHRYCSVSPGSRVTTSGSVANLIPAPDRDEAANALSLDNAMMRLRFSRDGTGDSFC